MHRPTRPRNDAQSDRLTSHRQHAPVLPTTSTWTVPGFSTPLPPFRALFSPFLASFRLSKSVSSSCSSWSMPSFILAKRTCFFFGAASAEGMTARLSRSCVRKSCQRFRWFMANLKWPTFDLFLPTNVLYLWFYKNSKIKQTFGVNQK